jgi:hypothetical protein
MHDDKIKEGYTGRFVALNEYVADLNDRLEKTEEVVVKVSSENQRILDKATQVALCAVELLESLRERITH